MNEKAIRYDIIIAVSALLISAIASVAVVYQTHVISEQFSATVWPYLSFEVTRDPSHLTVVLRNDGIGPALIRTVDVTYEGKRAQSLDAVIDPIVAKATQAHKGATRSTIASIDAGSVLAAHERVTLVRIQGAQATQALLEEAPHVNLSVCYCSLLGRCWIKQFNDRSGEPHDTARCH
ncbi:MAG TPA: hypothetical protein VN934_11630 [Candidatus Tumulicola sp.]|nr:hypothetical protein [Candidatus Tumulicola sp.]